MQTLAEELDIEPAAQVRSGLLEPILVRMPSGRVGSTLVMQLLGSSPDIFFDKVYPFEDRCLANLLYYLSPLRAPLPPRTTWWTEAPDRVVWIDPAEFGFDPQGQPLNYENLGVDRADVHLGAVRGVWQAFSAAAERASGRPLRYYAEKYSGYAEVLVEAGIPFRVLDIVRDPRDIWASIQAFDAKRGYYGFGRREGQSDEDYLRAYARSIRLRLDELAAPVPGLPAVLLRYEDLIADLAGETHRVGRWLGLPLDPGVVDVNLDSLRHHLTTETAADSVGRWRRDLAPAVVDFLESELGAHLDRLGYLRAGGTPKEPEQPVGAGPADGHSR